MKKIIIATFILIVGLTSCEDFLVLGPDYRINETSFYQSENDIETAMIGIYGVMQTLHNMEILRIIESASDNVTDEYYGGVLDEFLMTLESTNSSVNTLWTRCFLAIAYCNNILSKIEDVDLDDNAKDQYMGEALFIRAYNYFLLVRLFGEVPVIEVAFRSPSQIYDFDMSRDPVDDVYALIESDLTSAASMLSVVDLSKGRASVGAAKALLGKVYLTKGDNASASQTLKEVIDMGEYSLEADYGTLFTNNNDELDESIWEIKYITGDVGEGNRYSTEFTAALFNAALFPNDMQGAGNLVPTQSMFDAYEPGDLRKSVSVADTVPLLDGTVEQIMTGRKFVDFTVGTDGDGSINFTAIRYADVLLMYAEALNNSNQTTSAHTYLNMVRERAGLAPLSGSSSSEFDLALEKERRVEFLYEGHRWFDLIRTGRTAVVLNEYFESAGFDYTFEDYKLLMPIPLDEIEVDPSLIQNPGY